MTSQLTARDLRLGNLVQSKVNYLQKEHTTATFHYSVLEIKDLKVHVEAFIDGYRHFQKSTHLEYNQLEGIPLSETWLKRMGLPVSNRFVAWGTFTEVKHAFISEGLYLVDYGSGWHFAFCGEDAASPEIISDHKIEYVHTFQNGVYALTGKELQITEQ